MVNDILKHIIGISMTQKALLLLLVFNLFIPNTFCMNSTAQNNQVISAPIREEDNNTTEENAVPTIAQSWQKLMTLDWHSLSSNDAYKGVNKSVS